MALLWLVVGIVLTFVVFFIPDSTQELWPSLNLSGIVVSLYLIALAAYTLRSPFAVKTRIWTWVGVLLVGGALAVHWTGMDSTSHWQRQKLLKIGAVINRGIMRASLPDTLLNVLRMYHEQGPKKKETLGQIYRRMHLPGTPGQLHPAEWPTSPRIALASISDTEIVLVTQSVQQWGRKTDFKNYDGSTGKIQERATLTVKGVHYESEN